MTDHYRLLQVRRDASPKVIAAAYKRLIKDAHPDHGGDSDYAKRLNVAYEVLSNEESRRRYDRLFPPEGNGNSDRSLAPYLAYRLGHSIGRFVAKFGH